jgi:hypothetical protein
MVTLCLAYLDGKGERKFRFLYVGSVAIDLEALMIAQSLLYGI